MRVWFVRHRNGGALLEVADEAPISEKLHYPNEVQTGHLFTSSELEAHERKIWEAARDRLYQEGDFEWTFRIYDDYKRSLKNEKNN